MTSTDALSGTVRQRRGRILSLITMAEGARGRLARSIMTAERAGHEGRVRMLRGQLDKAVADLTEYRSQLAAFNAEHGEIL